MTARDILMGAAGAVSTIKTYIEDVFSTYLYTGTGSNQTITNNVNLSTNGGAVWIHHRNDSTNLTAGWFSDSATGVTNSIRTTATGAKVAGGGFLISSFDSTGFSLGTDTNSFGTNISGIKYVSHTFRKAPKFFDVQTKSHTNGTASTVDLSTLGTVGMVIVKRTDSTGNWYVWHNGLTSGYNAYLNTTAAQFNTNAYLSVSGTTLTIASGMPTGTYIVYAYAHDTTTDGLIRCGSYTGNGSTTGPSVNLGWEPQYVLIKNTSTGNWQVFDNMRGVATGYVDASLLVNTTGAETIATNFLSFTSTGFQITATSADVNTSGSTYIYMAIRRGPMKTPTDGTKVFQPVVRQGSGGAAVVNTTITPDLVIHKSRASGTTPIYWLDRLRDDYYIMSDSTNGTSAETQTTAYFPVQMWDNQTGYDIAGTNVGVNNASYSYIDWVFKRAPGFFDIVNVTTAATDTSHNLTVVPELVISKDRISAGTNWTSLYKGSNDNIWYVNLNSSTSATDYGTAFSSGFTSSQITSTGAGAFGAVLPAICYLFASCPGVSKVGIYTGTGTTQQIDCGFTAGARFVLIKRVDGAADWYVWDTARGITSGNDPYLLMNSTAAEVTSTSYINPYSAGFEISSTAPPDLRANGVTCLYLAIA